MKKIEFGHDNDDCPTGSWERIGIDDDLFLTEAEFYGAVDFNDKHYIICKVTKDEFNRYPELLNKFIVRQAACDLFSDGGTMLFLNQEQDDDCKKLESIINESKLKDKISSSFDLINYLDGVRPAPYSFKIKEIFSDNIIATSIKSEPFNRINKAINSCHQSLSSLQQENIRLVADHNDNSNKDEHKNNLHF